MRSDGINRVGIRDRIPIAHHATIDGIGHRDLDGTHQAVVVAEFLIQPGRSVLSLVSESSTGGEKADARTLAVALYAFELRALAVEE